MSWPELIARGALVAWMWVTVVLFRAQRKRIERLEQQQKHTLQLFEIEISSQQLTRKGSPRS